tara:strand:+ start:176 stop:688 length:513 start_codon:yes stop_codon:yes gene_type:complete
MRVKIVFGTDTGNTDYVINTYLLNLLQPNFKVEVLEVNNISSEDWVSHDFYILGIPTWYDGELQSDWDDYFKDFKLLNFTGKTFALFGLGDQVGYGEYFVDGIGILAKIILENGGRIVGYFPNKNYEFEKSNSLVDDNTFYGLALDEDNQSDLTQVRCKEWVNILVKELK